MERLGYLRVNVTTAVEGKQEVPCMSSIQVSIPKGVSYKVAKMQRLRAALAIMWHAYDTDNRPPHQIIKLAKECHDEAIQSQQKVSGPRKRSFCGVCCTEHYVDEWPH